MTEAGFVPPPYPHDRLQDLVKVASAHVGGAVDLSIGTPGDPPPAGVMKVLGESDTARGYPPAIGSAEFRAAAGDWLRRRFGVVVDPENIGACIGTKELVAGLPHWLRLRNPGRDTILFPALSYPTYAMGATLGGCRAVPVPVDDEWRIDLSAVDPSDVDRALALWVNTPGNPAGGLDDLGAVAAWGRRHGVLVLSDECYAEFTWDGEPRTVLGGDHKGVLALHSLSKRSNLAGLRVGFYTGDPELVHYLQEVRKHSGFMLPGPVQAAAAVAFADDDHVVQQREIYRKRLEVGIELLERAFEVEAPFPGGGFYLWVPTPGGEAWAFAGELARDAGVLVSPGEFYGPAGDSYVRMAMVQPEARLALAEDRLRNR